MAVRHSSLVPYWQEEEVHYLEPITLREPCCPLVVSPWCLLALLGGIAAATYLLDIVITMKLGRRRKRRRRSGKATTFCAPTQIALSLD
jgi:hypothetical protein